MRVDGVDGYGMGVNGLLEQLKQRRTETIRGPEGQIALRPANETEAKPSAFAQLLENAVASDNKADKATESYASGQSQDLHGTMLTVAKADINLALLVNVRNKLMDAYREIMRMS